MTVDVARLVRGLRSAQAAVGHLSRGELAEGDRSLQAAVEVMEHIGDVDAVAREGPQLEGVYRRLSSCVRALLGMTTREPGTSVRISCPACGVGFLEGELQSFRQLTLSEACAHCDATLLELQRHVAERPYPKDAREIAPAGRLVKLEEELEHIRHLAGLEHPTTVRWERRVAEEALCVGLVERARGLLTRAARTAGRLDDDGRAAVCGELAALFVAEGRLVDALPLLEQASGVGHLHLAATVRAALGRTTEARRGLLAVASSLAWPQEIADAQLRKGD